ncbi:MAG TPA: hypothetical protein VK747_18540 [Blastocatellia bacterium]|nr:hypothetical protein [Blastocatellia bacterium]
MKQLTASVYVVTTGEVVTIIATPVNLPPNEVLASIDGQTLANIDGATPTFRFGITEPADSGQIAKILCNFVSLPDDNTEPRMCHLRVQGSKGGDFTGRTINESDPLHAVSINFLVDDDEQRLNTIATTVSASEARKAASTKKK